jgi:sRNA-binding carbon storage regulator CsrA
VVRVTGDKVRLGIEAPANMLVLREELDVSVPAVGIGSAITAKTG